MGLEEKIEQYKSAHANLHDELKTVDAEIAKLQNQHNEIVRAIIGTQGALDALNSLTSALDAT